MAESSLHSTLTLGGICLDVGSVSIVEITGYSIISVAMAKANTDSVSSTMQATINVCLPMVGQSTRSSIGNSRCVGLQLEQYLLMLSDAEHSLVWLSGKFAQSVFFTDQSDSWVILRVSGKDCHQALERICPIDLHPDVFTHNAVARTTMEHVSTIIIRDSDWGFLLLSPRSFALSLLHAVEISARNIL